MTLRSSLLASETTSLGAEGLSKTRGRKVFVEEAREAFVNAFEEIRRKVKSEDIRGALEEERPNKFIKKLEKAGIVTAALLGAWKVFDPHFLYHANREVVYWDWDRRLVPGDSWVRAWLKKYGLRRVKDLSAETIEAVKIARQAVQKLPKGPVAVEVKEIPPGEGCGHAEAPRGETFHYVRSDGGNRPVRHKVRAPSYVNVPSFRASCIGEHIADVTITLAAVDPCYSCTERIAVVDSHNKILHDYDELLRLSRAKTAQLKKEIGAPEMKLEDF